MNNIIFLIAFISMSCYGINLILDCMEQRPIKAHLGYGVIAILSTYQINIILSYALIIVVILYTILTYLAFKANNNKS